VGECSRRVATLQAGRLTIERSQFESRKSKVVALIENVPTFSGENNFSYLMATVCSFPFIKDVITWRWPIIFT